MAEAGECGADEVVAGAGGFKQRSEQHEHEDHSGGDAKRYPEHPAGYFFYAVVLDEWTGYYQSTKKENEFYRYCDLAVEKGQAMLDKQSTDAWAKFFVGGTEGLKGNFESRYERWITAFRYGWKGVSILKDLQKGIYDPQPADFCVDSKPSRYVSLRDLELTQPQVAEVFLRAEGKVALMRFVPYHEQIVGEPTVEYWKSTNLKDLLDPPESWQIREDLLEEITSLS